MLTAREIEIVQESWEKCVPIADQAAAMFYGRLFELDPSLRSMFHATTIEEQGRKVMQMITVAVRGLTRIDQLVGAVEELGRRHGGYGVKESHYHTAGEALLWTLGQGLGEEFTPELHDAWAKTYWGLADIMIRAQSLAA